MSLLPAGFLFRLAIPVRQAGDGPRQRGALLDLPVEYRLPEFGALEGRDAFAELRLCWNAEGLGVQVDVAGKSHPVSCDTLHPEDSDGLQLWIDTRNTQNVHRATRFCHALCLLPAGAGRRRDQPAACQISIAQAREEPPAIETKKVALHVDQRADGYRLEAWLPAVVLNGFDPEGSPRLGFYYAVRDAELGEQFLSVSREFPFAHDPSLWATLELVP